MRNLVFCTSAAALPHEVGLDMILLYRFSSLSQFTNFTFVRGAPAPGHPYMNVYTVFSQILHVSVHPFHQSALPFIRSSIHLSIRPIVCPAAGPAVRQSVRPFVYTLISHTSADRIFYKSACLLRLDRLTVNSSILNLSQLGPEVNSCFSRFFYNFRPDGSEAILIHNNPATTQLSV